MYLSHIIQILKGGVFMSKVINISINENDLGDIDTYCTMHNLTRSKFFVQSALEKVQIEHMANGLILISGYLDKLDEGILTDEEKNDLKAVLRVYKGVSYVK